MPGAPDIDQRYSDIHFAGVIGTGVIGTGVIGAPVIGTMANFPAATFLAMAGA